MSILTLGDLFATRYAPPADDDGAPRVDPLARLFDDAFTDTTWYYEGSKVGDLPGKLHPKQVEALSHPSKHRWLFWGNQCTVKGTRVLTARGLIPCEGVAVGDVVFGPNGVRQPVVRTWQSPEPVQVYLLRTKRGYEVVGNAEHPLSIADQKRVGDWHGATVADEASARFLPLSEIQAGQYVRFGMRSAERGASDWPDESNGLTADDGYFLGLMTGDGWWHHGTTGRMSISASLEDEATIAWMEGYLAGRGIRTVRETRQEQIMLRWCNVAFRREVERWGVTLCTAESKQVPECVWRAPEPVARHFLRGLFDTDGCAVEKPAAILVTISPALAQGVHVLLARWGIGASLYSDTRQGESYANARPVYRVVMHGQKAARFKARIGFGLARKQAKLPDPSNRHNGAPRWERIESVTPMGEAIVYGFTCPPAHTFYANGLLHHNCGKTTLGAVDMALSALGRHPRQLAGLERMPPFTGWASALTWELWEKILLPELLSWIPTDRILDAPPAHAHSTKRDIVILADNGQTSRITGKAAEQGAERYQSARLDKVWLDEEHPESVWDEIQPRLLRFGGRSLATMTPLKGLTWVHGRVYEPIKIGRIPPERHWYSHAGLKDNPSITPEARAELLEELKHNPAQLAARDEGLFVRPFGAVLPWDENKHLVDVTPERMVIHRVRGAWYGALDLGKWRFAFQFGVADTEGRFLLVDELLSQNEDADVRAKKMHDLLRAWRVPDSISITGDCADPVGIRELNEAFDRINSPYRVNAIEGELKKKQAGIDRLESMLNRGAFHVRRGMGADHTWYLGRNASKPGKPVMGSRWLWEIANWQYPKTAEGKIQKDEPDDTTADGADMMDGARYIVMKFFPADAPAKPKAYPTLLERIQKEMDDMDRDAEQDEAGGDRYGGVLRQ